MGAMVLLIGLAAVFFVVVLVIVVVSVARNSSSSRPPTGPVPPMGAPVPPMSAPLPPMSAPMTPMGVPMAVPAALQTRVRVLLGENKPILAVKEVRQATGLGLKEAKQIVDALRSGPLPEPGPYPPGGPGSVAERARQVRDTGDFAGAVALVQAETGMGAEDAKRFVAALG
jgi:Ribosomal protein L7/L12 C-terminal domain